MTEKYNLIQKLYDEKHISFDEMLLLKNDTALYAQTPYIPFYPPNNFSYPAGPAASYRQLYCVPTAGNTAAMGVYSLSNDGSYNLIATVLPQTPAN